MTQKAPHPDTTVAASLGKELLHHLAKDSHFFDEAKCLRLIKEGASLNEHDIYGQTPLIWCAFHDHKPLAQLLVDKGAQLDLQDAWQCTALAVAVNRKNFQIASILLTAGARFDLKDHEGETVHKHMKRLERFTDILGEDFKQAMKLMHAAHERFCAELSGRFSREFRAGTSRPVRILRPLLHHKHEKGMP